MCQRVHTNTPDATIEMEYGLHMNVRSAQQQFLLILVLSVCLWSTLYIFFDKTVQFTPPPYSLKKRHITVSYEDGRRIGNLMFNYASLLGIATRNNMTPVLPDHLVIRKYFLTPMPKGSFQKSLALYIKYEEYGRRACAYDIGTEHLPEPWDIYLQGFFQSWKYFYSIDTELRRHFSWRRDIKEKAVEHIEHITPEDYKGTAYVRIGIHVRRGDLLEPKRQAYGYTVADADYIERAMAYFTNIYPKILFVVCSEDIPWCQENIKGTNVVFSYSGIAMVDMAILSLCDHTIMTVGSFGWWAAWLANGTTIYYKNWPRPVSKLEYDISKRQYFPEDWIAM